MIMTNNFVSCSWQLLSPASRSEEGGLLNSPPSVCPSLCPSVRPFTPSASVSRLDGILLTCRMGWITIILSRWGRLELCVHWYYTYPVGMRSPFSLLFSGPPTVENCWCWFNCWCWSDLSTICWSHFHIFCWTYNFCLSTDENCWCWR